MTAVTRWVDGLLGRGASATTVPILDGRLKPNTLLDRAETVAELTCAMDMVADGNGGLLIADAARVLRFAPQSGLSEVAAFHAPVTALVAMGQASFAVALDGREVRVVGGSQDGKAWSAAQGRSFVAINALCLHDGALHATEGSENRPFDHWCHDLMERGSSGRVIALRPEGAVVLQSGLQFAWGLCGVGDALWISESWRHRIDRIEPGGQAPVWDRLPGYPGRMAAASGGGVWVSIFARRTQLVEFVLREPEYRRRMMASIDPDYWIAPALRSGQSVLEPRQAGGIKQMGFLKPWAPPRSYGLIVRLSDKGLPELSIHSRVGGTNHGIVAVAELGPDLYALSKGADRLLRLPLAQIEQECLT